MWIADKWEDYELIDCGGGEKLERWGRQNLVRPDPQAIWETPHARICHRRRPRLAGRPRPLAARRLHVGRFVKFSVGCRPSSNNSFHA